MASFVMMFIGAGVNAAAFTFGNYLFSTVDKNGAREEAMRHNAAMEKLNREQMDYNIKRAKNLDWINTELAREQKATNRIYSTNSAFDEYEKLFGKAPNVPHPNLREPRLEYVPSEQQKMYENIFTAASTTVGVVAAISTLT